MKACCLFFCGSNSSARGLQKGARTPPSASDNMGDEVAKTMMRPRVAALLSYPQLSTINYKLFTYLGTSKRTGATPAL